MSQGGRTAATAYRP